MFGKKDEVEKSLIMASSITSTEFKDALSRYPAVLKTFSKPRKEGAPSLEELDKFRYQVAPMNFSKNTGRVMELADLQKLVDWKIHHGAFRPTLPKLIASNSDEKVAAAAKDAFAVYAEDSKNIAKVLEKLAAPLKGVGPATASLLLAIHDPQNVVFFSDELFRWLTADGRKVTPKYTTKEFEDLFSKAQTLMEKNKCTPIELEKVAFVLIKENEPVYEPKGPYVPSGKPRGRPALPDSEKKPKKPTVPGRGRGRPPANGVAKTRLVKAGKVAKAAKVDTEEETQTPASKKRGRPTKAEEDESTKTPTTKKRGRPAKVEAEETKTPASKKRKAEATPASSARRSGKKSKA